jgi:hypothetical protein
VISVRNGAARRARLAALDAGLEGGDLDVLIISFGVRYEP